MNLSDIDLIKILAACRDMTAAVTAAARRSNTNSLEESVGIVEHGEQTDVKKTGSRGKEILKSSQSSSRLSLSLSLPLCKYLIHDC